MNARNKTLLAVASIVVIVVVVVGVVLVMNQGPTTPGAPVTINGCTLKGGASCPNVDLSSQNLNGINISKGVFTGAKFKNSTMVGIGLGGTNVSGADFTSASMGGASLSGANFTNANMSYAILTNASGFDGANWSGAKFCQTRMPNGSIRTDPGQTC